MTALVHVKAVAGRNDARADQVSALAAAEAAKDVIARLEATVAGAAQRETT